MRKTKAVFDMMLIAAAVGVLALAYHALAAVKAAIHIPGIGQ